MSAAGRNVKESDNLLFMGTPGGVDDDVPPPRRRSGTVGRGEHCPTKTRGEQRLVRLSLPPVNPPHPSQILVIIAITAKRKYACCTSWEERRNEQHGYPSSRSLLQNSSSSLPRRLCRRHNPLHSCSRHRLPHLVHQNPLYPRCHRFWPRLLPPGPGPFTSSSFLVSSPTSCTGVATCSGYSSSNSGPF